METDLIHTGMMRMQDTPFSFLWAGGSSSGFGYFLLMVPPSHSRLGVTIIGQISYWLHQCVFFLPLCDTLYLLLTAWFSVSCKTIFFLFCLSISLCVLEE